MASIAAIVDHYLEEPGLLCKLLGGEERERFIVSTYLIDGERSGKLTTFRYAIHPGERICEETFFWRVAESLARKYGGTYHDCPVNFYIEGAAFY